MKLHVVLTKKDADILAFKNSLPKGEWSKHVEIILTAALKGEVADLPMNFGIKSIEENVDTKISLSEAVIEKCYKKLGCKKGTLTTVIKAEVRKCIRKNLLLYKIGSFSYTDLNRLFEQMLCRVDENISKLDSAKQKNKHIHQKQHDAMNGLISRLKKIMYEGGDKNG